MIDEQQYTTLPLNIILQLKYPIVFQKIIENTHFQTQYCQTLRNLGWPCQCNQSAQYQTAGGFCYLQGGDGMEKKKHETSFLGIEFSRI